MSAVPLARRRPRGVAVAAIVAGIVLLLVPVATAPIGRLGSALALLLVLPPLAEGLAAFGWPDRAVARLDRLRGVRTRVLVAYACWLGASALLGLDVAVLVAAFVAVAATRPNTPLRRAYLLAAIVGANAGSLLFPFSNLTNLVVAGAGGVAFAPYVAAALPPQLAAGVVGGVMVWLAAGRLAPDGTEEPNATEDRHATREPDASTQPTAHGRIATLAGIVTLLGGLAAVVAGFAGGDVVLPFAAAAAVVAALAIATGATSARRIAASLPLAGIAMVFAAAVAGALVPGIGAELPPLPPGPAGLVVAAIAGAALASVVNNLPAALLGALWLTPASAPVVVAYLVGTNIAAIATPHGSVATMLARTVAARDAEELSARRYVTVAWRYALPPALAALGAIALFAR